MCGYSECKNNSTTVKFGIKVCEEHSSYIWNQMRSMFFSQKIAKMFREGDLTSHSKGITYFMLLPNGNIKIGYSRNHDTLYKRLLAVQREHDGYINLVSTIEGGETMEAVIHGRFAHLLIRDTKGEQFKSDPSLWVFMNESGLEANGILAKQRYEAKYKT